MNMRWKPVVLLVYCLMWNIVSFDEKHMEFVCILLHDDVEMPENLRPCESYRFYHHVPPVFAAKKLW